MYNIVAFATEDTLESDKIDLEPYKDLMPGTKRLKISYYIGDPYGTGESLGSIDVFESGQMGCFADVEAGANIIHNDYVKICGENPQPIGRLKNGLCIVDNEKDIERMNRARTLLEEYGVTIRKSEERKQEVEGRTPSHI